VDSNSGANPHQHAGWFHVFRDCFAVESYYLRAADGQGNTQGVMPMYASRSILAGKHLSTMEGGALSNDAPTNDLFYAKAKRVSDSLGMRYLLVRGGSPPTSLVDYAVQTARSLIRVDDVPGRVWNRLSSNTRRKVRKARKNGFSVEKHPGGMEDFYKIYARRVRDLGTPTMGSGMFHAMEKYLKPYVRLYAVLYNTRIVGGMLLVSSKEMITSLYVAVNSDLLHLYPTYLLYWSVVEEAFRSPAVWLDLGRSIPGSGNHRFKQQWSEDERYVPYHYCFSKQGKQSRNMKQTHTETSLKQILWKRLPLPLANFFGPLFRRQLPFG
jgi:serine/alanine adding enzyme